MKLHTDGTIEGTPEEVAAYKRAESATDLRGEYIKVLIDKFKRAGEVHTSIYGNVSADEWRGFDGRFRTL